MHYYLYEIKNNINGKIYVGVHKTKNLDDGYMGSGKVIKSAIKKYGIENFTKIILETFDSHEAMFAREKEVVTEEFLNRDDTYNLRRGGYGGFDHINKSGLNGTIEGKSNGGKKQVIDAKQNKTRFFDEDFQKIINIKSVETHKRNKSGFFDPLIREKARLCAITPEANAKRKMTMLENGHQQGVKNSSFGTMWITNGTENKKIKKTESIPEGWNKGRKMQCSPQWRSTTSVCETEENGALPQETAQDYF